MKHILNRKMHNFQLFYLVIGLFFISNLFSSVGNQYLFPDDEYEHYMKLIQEIDAAAYNRLRECERINKIPCIIGTRNTSGDSVMRPTEKTGGQSFIIMQSIKEIDKDVQKEYLKGLVNWYNIYKVIPPLTWKERKKVMLAIQELAPELYEEIEKIDPNGKNHIVRNYEQNTSIVDSEMDGLPEIHIDPFTSELPLNELKYIIGHELGHYVLGHLEEIPTVYHRDLSKKEEGEQAFIEGKKVSGQLEFQETFRKAYQRTKEDEADRFAILELGVNIDDAISGAKKLRAQAKEEELKNPQQETFKRAHKLWADRIKHLESLRREVEIRRGRKPAPINWKKLAEDYKQQ